MADRRPPPLPPPPPPQHLFPQPHWADIDRTRDMIPVPAELQNMDYTSLQQTTLQHIERSTRDRAEKVRVRIELQAEKHALAICAEKLLQMETEKKRLEEGLYASKRSLKAKDQTILYLSQASGRVTTLEQANTRLEKELLVSCLAQGRVLELEKVNRALEVKVAEQEDRIKGLIVENTGLRVKYQAAANAMFEHVGQGQGRDALEGRKEEAGREKGEDSEGDG